MARRPERGASKEAHTDFPATDEDWRTIINHAWAADWSDPHEDIYTLADGKTEQ